MVEHATTASAVILTPASSSSLRRRLLLLAALLVVGPGLALTVIAERSASCTLEGVISGQLTREAGHTADRLSAVLQAEQESLRSLARQDVMRDLRVSDIDKRVALALAALRDGSPSRLDYLALSPAGETVAASRAPLLGGPPAWLPAAGNRLGQDGQVVGPVAVPDLEAPVLLLSARIADPDETSRTVGTLVGVLHWGRLLGLTEDVRRDLAARGIAADVVVTGADGTEIGGARSGHEGGEWITGRARLTSDLPEWSVVVRQPRSQALAPVGRLRLRLVLAMGLALAGALLLAALAARRVVRPLGELTTAIQEMARGQVAHVPVPVRGADEIATLAASFNDMASRLDQTQRELVEAEKFAFVGELAAGVAHEIRTSLGVLGSSAQILERSLPPDARGEPAELAQMVRAEAARLGGVVNDLLTLHRARPLQLEAVAVSEPLRRALEFVAPQAREKGVRLKLDHPSEEAAVRCDPELVQQVAINLLVNAVQAVPAGGSVEARVMPASEGEAGFEVRDDGPGIAPELRDRIFQPFVAGRPGGVGLGLTFVKRVVQEHRGSVSVEGGAGPGTRIRVRLPVAEGAP